MRQFKMFLLFLLFISSANAQAINWKQTSNWKIYALNRSAALSYRVDTLSHIKHIMLGDSAIVSLLSQAKLLPKDKYAAWQGFYIASYETADHEVRKVILSNYGGFLYDSHSNRYYELLEKHREKWNKLIKKYLDGLFNPKID